MSEKVIYLVRVENRDRHTEDTHDMVKAFSERSKAEKEVVKRGNQYAKELGIDLSNVDENEWDLVSNTKSHIEVWDSGDYSDGFSVWVQEIEVDEEKQFKIWADSDSYVEIPYNVEEYYDNYDDAYNAATSIVHKHDGMSYRVIIHIEDTELEETIDTFENVNPTLDA